MLARNSSVALKVIVTPVHFRCTAATRFTRNFTIRVTVPSERQRLGRSLPSLNRKRLHPEVANAY